MLAPLGSSPLVSLGPAQAAKSHLHAPCHDCPSLSRAALGHPASSGDFSNTPQLFGDCLKTDQV